MAILGAATLLRSQSQKFIRQILSCIGRQAGVGVTLFFDMFIISVAIMAQILFIRALRAALLPLCLFGVRDHGV
jgi:hypothetical protein